MSRKIIGATVGSPLPKSNLNQTDPTKGDYVKGRDDFAKKKDVQVLVVTFGYGGTSHSYDEIITAHNSGKCVVLILTDPKNAYVKQTLEYIKNDEANRVAYFGTFAKTDTGIAWREVYVRNRDVINVNSNDCYPDPSEEYNGMVLQVVDGKATWAEVETGASSEELESIKQDIAELKYDPIAINSFTVTPSKVEVGATVESITLKWTLNKKPKSQLITGNGINAENPAVTDSNSYSKTYSGLALTSKAIYNISVTDEKQTITKATTLYFYKPLYHGALDANAEITSEVIRSLPQTLNSTKNISFKATTVEGQKLTYAQPASYADPVFTIDNFPYSWNKIATFEFENSSGHVESYTVWQEPECIPGTSTVSVS